MPNRLRRCRDCKEEIQKGNHAFRVADCTATTDRHGRVVAWFCLACGQKRLCGTCAVGSRE